MNSSRSKARLLASLLASRPREAADRVRHIVEAKLEAPPHPGTYDPIGLEALPETPDTKEFTFSSFLTEPECAGIEKEIGGRISAMTSAPFKQLHSADFALARVCYAVCRAIRPDVVVETGVAYGVTSSFILKALDVNGHGALHSIDLPPLASRADDYVGCLIPDALRGRWQLHRGSSERLLAPLLQELPSIGVFVHDSLHTYRTMTLELNLAVAHLARPGYVVADDIEGNVAFGQFVSESQPQVAAAVSASVKESLLGIAYFS